ncbi:MAG: thioredoxin domain-containing protein [Sphingomonadales bacterium]|nr:thioredoxin domain-containing protein [Sphingomonadales bacterium]
MIRRLITLALAASLSIAAGPPAGRINWNTTVAVTPAGSHVVGNPAAKAKLTEWVSYTCPHCSRFEIEGDAPIRLAYVMPGKLQVEVRHLVRDPVDMTVAMLTNCGPVSRFFLNHTAFMRSQSTWIQTMATAGDAQRQRWSSGEMTARMRAIANDFHFYDIMETRGYGRVAVDRCLADQAMLRRLTAMTEDAANAGVASTPSFAIDGVVLAGTHNWQALDLQLRARLNP